VDVSSETGRDPVDDFEIIRKELKSYSPAVIAKPQIAVANKMDALDDPARLKQLETHLKRKKLPLLKLSGATGDGVPALLEAMWKAIAAGRKAVARAEVAARREALAADAADVSDRESPARARPRRRRSSPSAQALTVKTDKAATPKRGAGASDRADSETSVDLLTPARTRRRGA